MELHAERPGRHYDDAFWRAVHVLYDEAFPSLSRGIARAEAIGLSWREMTTPFAFFEEGRCIAHVGVLAHPMRFADRDASIAGIHAVCTAEDRRREGLCRTLLAHALAWADARHATAKLSTDLPAVYEGHGFRVVPTHRFRSAVAPAANVRTRRLRPSQHAPDEALLKSMLARRAPVSRRCASVEPGWLVLIDAALSDRLDTAFLHLPEHDAICVFADEGDRTLVVEVIAETLPSADVVAGAAPAPERSRLYSFAPDLFEPDAVPEPTAPSHGAFMVRGPWLADGPFGVSPFWEH